MSFHSNDHAGAAVPAVAGEGQGLMTAGHNVTAEDSQQPIIALQGAPTNASGPIEATAYPIPIQLQQNLAEAAAGHHEQQMQGPPTSSAQPLANVVSPADSMATEGQAEGTAGSESNGAALEVDPQQVTARLQRREQPAFIQTSALIPNSCGYCGTRNTSGCWRRGWEIDDGKCINLCNKCGLRHKAGKLHSVPQPAPPMSRCSANPASARATSRSNGFPSAADQEAALAAASAAAASAGLPLSSASVLLKVMRQQLMAEQQRGISAAAGFPAAAAAAMLASRSSPDLQGLAVKAEQVGYLDGTWDHNGLANGMPGGVAAAAKGRCRLTPDAVLASAAAAAAAAVAAGAAGPLDSTRPDSLSLMGPSGLLHTSAAAPPAAAASEPTGLPDFAAAAAAAASKVAATSSLHYLSELVPESCQVAAAAAGAVQSAGLNIAAFEAQLSDMSPEMAAYLGSVLAGGEPAPKRRRTKKPAVPGPSVAAGGGAGRVRVPASAGQQQQGLQRADSLAAGAAADALLALNRSSASASPVGSPSGPAPAASAPAPATPQLTLFESAAAAAADHAAAVAERAAAAAVDAAAAAAGGWSPALEAFLAGQPGKRGRGSSTGGGGGGGGGGAAAVAARAGSSRAAGPTSSQLVSRQVSSPGPILAAGRAASGCLVSTNQVVSPRGWTAEQLHAWLHASNCGEAVRVFRDQEVDGQALAGLLRVVAGGEAGRLYELLGGDLGVQHVGLRLRLVESIMLAFGGH